MKYEILLSDRVAVGGYLMMPLNRCLLLVDCGSVKYTKLSERSTNSWNGKHVFWLC